MIVLGDKITFMYHLNDELMIIGYLKEECEELLRERQELRNEIARARGTVAQERVKADKCLQKDKVTSLAGRKQMMRKVEDLRATLVSNLPPSKPQSSGVKRTVRVQYVFPIVIYTLYFLDK